MIQRGKEMFCFAKAPPYTPHLPPAKPPCPARRNPSPSTCPAPSPAGPSVMVFKKGVFYIFSSKTKSPE